ncbi:hypothetical protein ID866_12414 [Astraeus odoratus]|nr:hypothetical protein ID866_12414 [Astraeus odoratus]
MSPTPLMAQTQKNSAFCLDAWKVGFALSFLKGITLAWFEPNLLDTIPSDEPAWADDYSKFVIKLTTNFSPHNPVSNAKHWLDNLSMKDSSHINKYIVKFNHLATQVYGYGEGALQHMFYNGLPDHIKDEITCVVLIWRIFLQTIQHLLQHLLLIFHWQREEPTATIFFHP